MARDYGNSTLPAENSFDITPSDTEPLETVTRAVYVGTGGDLAVKMYGAGEPIFKNVPDGTILMGIRVDHVLVTGTTASDIIGLY